MRRAPTLILVSLDTTGSRLRGGSCLGRYGVLLGIELGRCSVCRDSILTAFGLLEPCGLRALRSLPIASQSVEPSFGFESAHLSIWVETAFVGYVVAKSVRTSSLESRDSILTAFGLLEPCGLRALRSLPIASQSVEPSFGFESLSLRTWRSFQGMRCARGDFLLLSGGERGIRTLDRD